jgi:ADP-ribose pyrophosphatase
MPRLIEKQVVYDGKKVRLEIHRIELDDGTVHKAEVVAHRGAVVILPLLADDTVLLIRNRRYAVGQTLLELPAGTLDKGEDPINAAGRELQEETGYVAGRLRPIGAFFSSPGILSEKMYAYVATDLEPGERGLEAGEEIELQPTPLAEAIDLIGTGQLQDAKSIAAILMYDRFRRNPSPAQQQD